MIRDGPNAVEHDDYLDSFNAAWAMGKDLPPHVILSQLADWLAKQGDQVPLADRHVLIAAGAVIAGLVEEDRWIRGSQSNTPNENSSEQTPKTPS